MLILHVPESPIRNLGAWFESTLSIWIGIRPKLVLPRFIIYTTSSGLENSCQELTPRPLFMLSYLVAWTIVTVYYTDCLLTSWLNYNEFKMRLHVLFSKKQNFFTLPRCWVHYTGFPSSTVLNSRCCFWHIRPFMARRLYIYKSSWQWNIASDITCGLTTAWCWTFHRRGPMPHWVIGLLYMQHPSYGTLNLPGSLRWAPPLTYLKSLWIIIIYNNNIEIR